MIREIINLSSSIENKLANLYKKFALLFPMDAQFWETIAEEEEHHADVINLEEKSFLSGSEYVREFYDAHIEDLRKAIAHIDSISDKYTKQENTTREAAFQDAISLENGAGEIHYQIAMTKKNPSWMLKRYIELNSEDENHAKRMKEYSKTIPKID